MLIGRIGAMQVPAAVGKNPRVVILEGLVEIIHGEKPYTAAQRAHFEPVLMRVLNNIEARQEAGHSPGMTPADFALLYHTFR